MENIFFIIGAQRSGTTFLAQCLDSHPDINMAKPLFPEPKFFLSEDNCNSGKDFYIKKYYQDINRVGKWFGEKSTSYSESEQVGIRIKNMFPDSKIIVSLRNPVNRAISNFFFSKNRGIETRTLREVFIENKPLAVELEKYSVSPLNYLSRGEYITWLKPYISLFGKESVKVLVFEKLIAVKSEMESLYDFLNIKRIEHSLESIDLNSSEYSTDIEVEVIEFLQKYYRRYNDELEKFLNIDLSFWK